MLLNYLEPGNNIQEEILLKTLHINPEIILVSKFNPICHWTEKGTQSTHPVPFPASLPGARISTHSRWIVNTPWMPINTSKDFPYLYKKKGVLARLWKSLIEMGSFGIGVAAMRTAV